MPDDKLRDTSHKAVRDVFGYNSDIQSTSIKDKGMKEVFWSNNIYNRRDIEWYDKFNRFGVIDPYNAVTNTKEYIFFTKPDLNICVPGISENEIGPETLNPDLKNIPFFVELVNRYPQVVCSLQRSINSNSKSPFMNVLTNAVKNTIDISSISASEIDTAQTIFGTSIEYRGDGFSADEKIDFSLEFEDTKYLEIYQLTKTIEEYSRLKKIGMIKPPNIDNAPVDKKSGYYYGYYTKNRVLHDQFGIYKMVLEDDMETIIYYAKLCGVMIKSVPRDAFSELKADNGLRYNIDFKAAFIEDTTPEIIDDFNLLIRQSYGIEMKDNRYNLPVYSDELGTVNGAWATCPYIERFKKDPAIWLGPNSMKYGYKLKWRLKE